MISDLASGSAEAALAAAEAAVAGLQQLALDGCTGDDVLDLWRRVETINRKLVSLDHAIIAQVQSRQLPFEHGARSTATFARDVLRIPAAEATARVKAAEACGPRTGLTGDPLPPIFGHVAAAQAVGTISAGHARIITSTVDRLPHEVQSDHGEQVEQELVRAAAGFDPDALTKLARRVVDHLDPDGLLDDADYRHRNRELNLRTRPDGSARLEGELSAELGELLRTSLEAVAAPTPSIDDDGVTIRDTRSAGQRRHDGLLDLLRMALRAREVPHSGGVTTTVILTGNVLDWANATGTVRTGHGVTLATREAHRWVGGDTRFLGVLWNGMREVRAYTSTRRLFTENDRHAMVARDGGCSIPGCDAPPGMCQAHHITEYSQTGTTSIDDGALICTYHHRLFEQMGWHGVMINGVPHWRPPKHLDPKRTPRRNYLHHPEDACGRAPTAPART